MVLLDQLTKVLVATQKFFAIKVVQNPGLAFGITLPGFFAVGVTILLLGIFVFFYLRSFSSARAHLGFGLILGGALSNIWDRLADGRVTDFINLGLSTMNFADIAIICGIIWLVFLLIKPKT